MNGEPLPPVHGAPLRVVVPGYIGARSVKWLERIEVRSRPWEGYFQHVAYRLLPEDGTPGPGAGMPLGLVALNADVLSPADGETVAAGPVEVRGYAFAGGERHVARVDVSLDGGASWSQAELLEDLGPWAWRHWRITVDLAPGEHEIVVRAWDSSAATQPEEGGGAVEPEGVREQRPPAGPAYGSSPLSSARGRGPESSRRVVQNCNEHKDQRPLPCALREMHASPPALRTRARFGRAPGLPIERLRASPWRECGS